MASRKVGAGETVKTCLTLRSSGRCAIKPRSSAELERSPKEG
ncbi:MAG: hypothetical protein N3B18_08845 [Desulfobacterota bacterium]|nr:hypothetical protein [Thermodesulfobacteriota bacterium]